MSLPASALEGGGQVRRGPIQPRQPASRPGPVRTAPQPRRAPPTGRGSPPRRAAPTGRGSPPRRAAPTGRGAPAGRRTEGRTQGRAPGGQKGGADLKVVARARQRRAEPAPSRAPSHLVEAFLGLAWVGLLLGGLAGGPVILALLLVPVVAVAAASALGSTTGQRRASRTRRAPVVVLAAAVVPLSALAGGWALGLVWAVATGLALLTVGQWRGGPGPLRAALMAGAPALAAGCLVLARRQGDTTALVLIGALCLFDVANYVVGTGRTGGVGGALVGAIAVGGLAVLVAAIIPPPFTGSSPWILLGLVAALAPLGVQLSAWLVRGRAAPALERLDSAVLAAPAWVIAVAILLHK